MLMTLLAAADSFTNKLAGLTAVFFGLLVILSTIGIIRVLLWPED